MSSSEVCQVATEALCTLHAFLKELLNNPHNANLFSFRNFLSTLYILGRRKCRQKMANNLKYPESSVTRLPSGEVIQFSFQNLADHQQYPEANIDHVSSLGLKSPPFKSLTPFMIIFPPSSTIIFPSY